VAIYGAEIRNTVAAAIAAKLGGSRLFLLSEQGRVLAILPMPGFTSETPGVIETGKFDRVTVLASGDPTRYEIRPAAGFPLLSGAGAELKINPASLIEGGLVYVDSFVLTV